MADFCRFLRIGAFFLKRQRQKEEDDGVYMGESGEVVQRRAGRFVFTKNTAFFARHTKRTQAQKQQNTKNTADNQESRVSKQGDNSNGGTVQHPDFFFFKWRKGLFFVFPVEKKSKKLLF